MPRVRVWIRTDKVGSECDDIIDVPGAELEDEDEFEKEVQEIVFQWIDWGFEILKDEETD